MRALDAARLTADHTVRADAVVVGTGAGGAVAAAELARAGLAVVMLEEGGYVTGRELRADARQSFATVYRNGGLTGTVGLPPIPVPLGRCVGGTTTVNSGTSYRTPGFVLEAWEREHGLEGATELGEDYDAIERDLAIEPVADALYGPANGRVEAACAELGWKGSRIPRNADGCLATGACALGCPSDAKTAMSVSKVPEALAHGAELWVHARVERVLHHRGRAIGVAVRVPDRRAGSGMRAAGHTLVVTAELVVIACGAFHTPALLQVSGLGNRWVGRNLHLHPATRLVARFPEAIEGWREVPQAYNVDEFLRDGVFIQGQFVPPDVQAPVVPGWGHAHKERMAGFGHLASFGALISDHSAGRVWATGGRPDPIAAYRLGRADVRKLRFGIARTAEVLFAAGAEEVWSGVAPMPVLRDPREVAELERLRVGAGQLEVMAFHPMGTARAGAEERAACDPWGRVHGSEGLCVADASLLPTSNRINPQLTIMALARRAARAWAARGR